MTDYWCYCGRALNWHWSHLVIFVDIILLDVQNLIKFRWSCAEQCIQQAKSSTVKSVKETSIRRFMVLNSYLYCLRFDALVHLDWVILIVSNQTDLNEYLKDRHKSRNREFNAMNYVLNVKEIVLITSPNNSTILT